MQIHPLFLEVLTRERELDVERRRRSALARRRRRTDHTDSVSIRLAQPSDSAAVGRVAGLDAGTAEGVRVAAVVDSGERPGVLLAEIDGSPIAALDLSGGAGRAYGDPFRRSAAAITQLRARARQLGAGGRARRLWSTLLRPEPRRV
jgi:hypothetical protein